MEFMKTKPVQLGPNRMNVQLRNRIRDRSVIRSMCCFFLGGRGGRFPWDVLSLIQLLQISWGQEAKGKRRPHSETSYQSHQNLKFSEAPMKSRRNLVRTKVPRYQGSAVQGTVAHSFRYSSKRLWVSGTASSCLLVSGHHAVPPLELIHTERWRNPKTKSSKTLMVSLQMSSFRRCLSMYFCPEGEGPHSCPSWCIMG